MQLSFQIFEEFLAHVETCPSSGGNTDVAQLAASIKHRMLECEACDIDCLGPESIFRSLSAMHLAMVFVKRERAESRTLCLRPEEMHVASKPESMDPSIDANENADETVQEAWQKSMKKPAAFARTSACGACEPYCQQLRVGERHC